MDMDDLISHIENERGEADYWRTQGEAGTITLNTQQADLLADLLLEAYGITLVSGRAGLAVSDNLACLAAAFKGEGA